jgi:hypothetical protein
MAANESLRASDYASGFMSNYFAGRRVPDACGLVGMQPKAMYIMLPIDPGCEIDTLYGGGAYPNGDQTLTNDGWGCFSGTSAAAPQLAGLAALIKQACPRLTPADVRDIMRKTARDVTAGNCSASTGGHPATAGPDVATGDGLVDAHKAVLLAKVRCLSTVAPAPGIRGDPIRAVTPREPEPIRSVVPREPGPIEPRPGPILPTPRPTPVGPVRPGGGVGMSLEAASLQAQAAAEAQPVPLTPGDIQALEELVVKSELRTT